MIRGWILLLPLALSLCLIGCGDDTDTDSSNDAAETTDRDSDDESKEDANSDDSADSVAHTDENGRKWIGDVPYDVWYPDPLAVYQDNQQTIAATAPTQPNAAPTNSDGNTSTPNSNDGNENGNGSAGGGDAWQDFISAEIITAESKEIRNRLTLNLTSVGKYNGNYKAIRIDGAALAALAYIAMQHPDEVSWKDRALYVRDSGWQIEQNSQGLGRSNFDATQIPYEHFVTVMNGSTPTVENEPVPEPPIEERVDRGQVMQRMQRAFDYLRKNVPSAEVLKNEAEKARHETAILAAFMKVAMQPGYDSSEDEDYLGHAREILLNCKTMAEAIETANYDSYDSALSTIQKKCDECHTDYRFAEDF